MEWLRLVGSLKLEVSFAESSPFYRALLQKRPIIFRSLLIMHMRIRVYEKMYICVYVCVYVKLYMYIYVYIYFM